MTDLSSVAPVLDLDPDRLGPRLAAFLESQWQQPVRLSGWQRFPAGFSWVTLGFRAFVGTASAGEERELILRIGDPRGLLAPYHAEPEYLALRALQDVAALPVPVPHAYSDDYAVIGAPFLVTGRVAGDTPMPWRGDSERRDAAENASLSRDFTDAMAALHRFDWRPTPLRALWGDVDPGEVAMRQVVQWAAHAGMDERGGGEKVAPAMHYAVRWLVHHAPAADRVSIVHGDFRVGNFLQQGGRITAVLDWELMHPGDPHEDIAWAGLRIFSAGSNRIGGLVERDAFLQRYAQQTGFTLRPEVVRYYEVLGLFKSVSMLLGAIRRIESGAAHDIRMASMGFQVASTLLELNRLISEIG